MDDGGRDFGERDENEPSPREARMRDGQATRLQDPAAREENVDIENPRPFRNAGPPAGGRFHRLDEPQERFGSEPGFDGQDLVEKPGLVR